MIKVSIITVSHNSVDTISKTINSVKNQTYDNIEYIVVDGESSDGTKDVIKECEDFIDKWVSERDEGIYDAINKGIRMSSGDVIGILNSDDWYEPATVATAVEQFDDGIALVHGAMRLWSEEGEVETYYGMRKCLPKSFETPFNHPTCFVHSKVYSDIGLFKIEYPTAADYDFMLRFLQSEYKSRYVDQVFTNMRQGGVTSRQSVPLAQLWRILRSNEYGVAATTSALGFRLLRDGVAWLVNRPHLVWMRNWLRRFIPYHGHQNDSGGA